MFSRLLLLLPVLRIGLCTKVVVAVVLASSSCIATENAAVHYLLAFNETQDALPDYVDSSTTDSREFGFSVPLSDEQRSYIEREQIVGMLQRIEFAAKQPTCDWGRFDMPQEGFSHGATINSRAHRAARIASLVARVHYEDGNWQEGNALVLVIMRLARHLSLQCRPGEHRCYMIENIARGTVAAYLLDMPKADLLELQKQLLQIGPFQPYKDMLQRESAYVASVGEKLAADKFSAKQKSRVLYSVTRIKEAAEELDRIANNRLGKMFADYAEILGDGGNLMKAPLKQLQSAAGKELQERIRRNRLATLSLGDSDTVSGFWRENAQSICRYRMMQYALQLAIQGEEKVAPMTDPYGSSPLTKAMGPGGFVLRSELVYHSQIDLGVGRDPFPE